MSTLRKCVVITTIHSPSAQVLYYCNVSGWDTIIVGDLKTKAVEYADIKCVYLGVDAQKEMFPSLFNLIPYNSYTRKMFGYLYAIRHKYDIIYDTDDDNQFIPPLTIDEIISDRPLKVAVNDGFTNIYKLFTDSHIWPRGIPPLHHSIHEYPTITNSPTNLKCGVIQGLVNNDPDVDAYYRMNVNSSTFFFEKDPGFDVLLDKNSVCPFNTQNTFWIDKDIFYTMYLPTTVSFRYTDIFRGFVALFQMWKHGKTIKFTLPTAVQIRNCHDIADDYKQETNMYETAEKVIDLLGNNPNASIRELYTIFIEHNIINEKELIVLDEWLRLIDNF